MANGYAANLSKVSGGSLIRSEKDDYSDYAYNESYEYSVDGEAAHIKQQNWDKSYYDTYLVPAEDEIVAVKKEDDGSYSRSTDSYEEAAYHFNYYLGSGSSYGAEGFLDDLVKKAKSNPNGDFTSYEEEGTTYFSYGYYEGEDPWSYYIVEVSLPSYTEGSGLSSLSVKFTEYSSMYFIFDDETGKITLLPDASINQIKTYEIAQTIDARTYVNEIDLTSFEYTSFSLSYIDKHDSYDEEDYTYTPVNEGDSFSVAKGDSIEFALKDILPATANSDFDNIDVTYSGGAEGGLYGNFSSYSNTVSISGEEIGTYDVTVSSKNVSIHFSVTVTTPQPKSISSITYYTNTPNGLSSSYVDEEGSGFSACLGLTYYLQPNVLPYNADKSLDVTSAAKDGSTDSYSLTKTEVKISEWDDEMSEVYAFSANKAGSYDVTFTSTVLSSITRTITIEVKETSEKEALSKSYALRDNYGSGPVKYAFAFAPTDNDSGSVTITDKLNSKSETASYSLGEKIQLGRVFSLTHVSGDEFISDDFYSLVLGSDYKLYAKYSQDDYAYNEAKEATPSFYAIQKWEGSNEAYRFSFNLYESGMVSGNLYKDDEFDGYLSCNWEIASEPNADGSYTISFVESGGDYDDYGPFSSFPASVTLSSSMDTITAETNVGTFEMKYVASGRGD